MAYVSVITGGTGGMGIEIAKRLAKNTKILLCGRRESKLAEAKAALKDCENVEYAVMDVVNRDDIKAAVEKAREMGEVKNVIHAAGVNEFTNGKPNDPGFILENNIKGAQYIAEAFLPIICEGGSYLNIASMSSYYNPLPDYIDAFVEAMGGNFEPVKEKVGSKSDKAYAVSKMFVRWYTLSSIQRAAARGARINSISPGLIWTPMAKEFEDVIPGSMTAYATTLPVPRMGEASEIADLVEQLCDNGYINGCDILIDGGNIGNLTFEQFDEFETECILLKTTGRK